MRPTCSFPFSLLVAFLSPTRARSQPVPADFDPGFWSVSINGGSAASGWRWHDLYANYSGTPDTTTRCRWVHNPELHNDTTTCSGEPSFYYLWSNGQASITMQQTVGLTVAGSQEEAILVKGTSPFTYKSNLGANGRQFEGAVRVTATVVHTVVETAREGAD
ncbi:hypothetical protein B0T25DRAFT_175988 [Lasiosphaeria hispida]|uniref:Uncharacterized protein n=1 Tax=Lasiosphaeria hispida TaxID=260671 RepID=A0AAJ0HNK7_9PEZI|nr:hypothetical protein B0T25DRAFT_175988 [Lasiosphaeria hispida]